MSRHPSGLLALAFVVSLVVACAPIEAAGSRVPDVTAAPTTETGGIAGGATGSDAPVRASARPVATAAPVPTPTPAPTSSLAPPTTPFAMNLYRKGDYISQYTFEWCVGASIQMTLNMLGPTDDRSRALQQELWEMARDRSMSPFGGASPIGWTKALNDLGAGPYELVSVPDLHGALRTAAAAIRETERPVGLVMWSGRHAWMMSGFTALGDPAAAANFEVTGVRVLDPLYPHGSSRWGPSPKPNALLEPAVVGEQFVARLGGRVDLKVAPGYLLILPRPAA